MTIAVFRDEATSNDSDQWPQLVYTGGTWKFYYDNASGDTQMHDTRVDCTSKVNEALTIAEGVLRRVTNADPKYLSERMRVVRAAVGEKRLLAENGALSAAWEAYENHVDEPEGVQVEAIRQAVDYNSACLDAIEPSVDSVTADEGGGACISWITAESERVDFSTYLSVVGAPEVCARIGQGQQVYEVWSLEELRAIVADLQRAERAWSWLERERRESEVSSIEYTLRKSAREEAGK